MTTDTERLVEEIATKVMAEIHALDAGPFTYSQCVKNIIIDAIRAALLSPGEGESEQAARWKKHFNLADRVTRAESEIKRLRATLERADYYINRLEAAHRGHVVRDLDEACNAWESCKHRLASPTPALPTTPPDFIDTIAMETACKIFARAPNATDDVTRAKEIIAGGLLAEIERLRAGQQATRLFLDALSYNHTPDGDVQIMAQRIDGTMFENLCDGCEQLTVKEG